MSGFVAGSISFTVEAETGKLLTADKVVANFNQKAQDGFDKTDRSVNNLNTSMGKLTTIAKAVSAALLSSKIISYAESWNELEDRIQNTGLTASQTKDTLNALLETSNRNGRAIEESAELYIKLSNSMKELGYSSNETTTYIGSMSDLFTINQTKAMGAEAAINALTKAQMKGKLSGIEAMTVFSNMPSVLGTLVNYFKKNAKSTAEADKITEQYVKQLATDGKLSIKEFTNALIDSNTELDSFADNMRNKTSDALQRIENNLKHYLGELNNSTGATKLLVDSLILASEHVNILVNGVGMLAAVLAGKYLTSLVATTKAKIDSAASSSKEAKAEIDLAKAELARITQKKQELLLQKQNIELAQVHSNSLRAQISLNNQLATVEAGLTTVRKQEAAATLLLNNATKAASVSMNILKSGLSLLGGPAGLLFLVAGGIASLAMSANSASPNMRDYSKSIDEIKKSLEGLNKAQLEGREADLRAEEKAQQDKIKGLEKEIRIRQSMLDIIKDPSQWGDDGARLRTALQFGDEAEITDWLAQKRRDLYEETQKLNNIHEEQTLVNDKLASSTDKVTTATKGLTKGWDDASKQDITKKVNDLSKELDVATLKADKNFEAAHILNGLYSALGNSADEYREDLIKLVKGQTGFTKLTAAQAEELKDLIDKYKQSYKLSKISKDSTKDYTEEVKKLNKDLNLLSASYSQTSAEAQILALEQETNTKVIGKQRQELTKLFSLMDGYKSLAKIENPLTVEEDSYNNAKAALDDWLSKNENKQKEYHQKLEKLESDHQIKMAEIKANTAVSDIDKAVAQVDPVLALKNEHERKLALIQEYQEKGNLIESQALALREAANTQYEQNRIAAQWEIWRNQNEANQLLASSLEGLSSSATSTISGLMSGTMNATDAMKNFANVILNEAVGSLVKMGMQQVQNAIMGQAAAQASTAAQITGAIALAEAYTPAAIQASIATEGAAAVTGQAAYIEAMGAMKGAALASFGGGRLTGGIVDANKFYRVNESGQPEMLVSGGKQYMLPNKNGEVIPANKLGGNSQGAAQISIVINNNNNSNVSIEQQDNKVIIDLAAKEAVSRVANDLSSGSGNVSRALRNRWNTNTKTD